MSRESMELYLAALDTLYPKSEPAPAKQVLPRVFFINLENRFAIPTLETIKEQYVDEVIYAFDGDVKAAARQLGISYDHLRHKLADKRRKEEPGDNPGAFGPDPTLEQP